MDVENQELEHSSIFLILVLITGVVLCPLLLIWALNTLFHTGIALTLKNWLAAAVLMGIVKFVLIPRNLGQDDYDDDYYDDEEDDEDPDWDYEYDFPEAEKKRRKANLILYQKHKNERKSPPEEKS